MIIEAKYDAQPGDYIGPITVKNQAFAVAIWGASFTGSVKVQARPVWRDLQADWVDEKVYTAPAYEVSVELVESWEVRVYVDTITTGTLNVSLAASDGQP